MGLNNVTPYFVIAVGIVEEELRDTGQELTPDGRELLVRLIRDHGVMTKFAVDLFCMTALTQPIRN